MIFFYILPVFNLEYIADKTVRSTTLNKIFLRGEELFRINFTIFLMENRMHIFTSDLDKQDLKISSSSYLETR